MTRTMYDSTNPNDIPANAQMVAGYISGYAWSASGWARFPNAVKVHIATQASVNGGEVLDVEKGDATPSEAPGWVKMRRQAGIDPTVYCTLSAWPAVRAAFGSAGVAEPHYWIAAWNNKAELIAGAVAHQYADPPMTGHHYDLSVVADYWPGVDSKQEESMILVQKKDGGPIYHYTGNHIEALTTHQVQRAQSLGAKLVTLNDSDEIFSLTPPSASAPPTTFPPHQHKVSGTAS